MTDYENVLADLKAQKTALDRERSELDGVIAGIERLIAARGTRQQTAAPAVAPRAFAKSSMPEAIKECLKLAQEPQSKRQLQDVLKAGGIKTSKSFSAHVYNTLKRLSESDGPFRRESDGRWGLREWPTTIKAEPVSASASMTH